MEPVAKPIDFGDWSAKLYYDLEWINDGPFGNPEKSWADYTFEELVDIVTKEHELWRTDHDSWVAEGGSGKA